MKITVLAILILLNIVFPVQASAQENSPDLSTGNREYLRFDDSVWCEIDGCSSMRCLPKKELGWQKQEVRKWKNAIRKAADMLPQKFFKETGVILWEFFVDRSDWATASVSYSAVTINLLSNYKNPPGWMVWEPLRKNGLSETEKVWVALHEMAHVYSIGNELNVLDEERVEYQSWVKWDWDKNTKQLILLSGIEESRVIVLKETEVTLYGLVGGRMEDFAEAFALYVMWPEYLRTNFPKHYEVMEKILVVKYEPIYPMPNSIKSRLGLKENGSK